MFFASHLLGLRLPYGEIWVPLLVGIGAGGLCIALFHAFFQKRALDQPVPTKKKEQEYDPFVQGSPTEQRKAYRRTGNPVEVLIAVENSDRPEWRGWVLDRSVGGLCVSVNEEFTSGTQLRLLPVSAPSLTPWTEIEVRSCRAVKEGFEIGCQFVKQPSWAVLLLFG